MMLVIKNLELFLTISFVLIITPGPDSIYVLSNGMASGKKTGITSAIGVTCGILIHTLFAAFGLSIILKSSAIAFSAIKYTGVAYLIFLGIKSILHGNKSLKSNLDIKEKSLSKVFIRGLLSNTLNPKVALFFLAFLPQFIGSGTVYQTTLSTILLGLLFTLSGAIYLCLLGSFAGYIHKYLHRNDKFSRYLHYFSGLILILLGLRLSLIKRIR